jgi:hypothetical protein
MFALLKHCGRLAEACEVLANTMGVNPCVFKPQSMLQTCCHFPPKRRPCFN